MDEQIKKFEEFSAKIDAYSSQAKKEYAEELDRQMEQKQNTEFQEFVLLCEELKEQAKDNQCIIKPLDCAEMMAVYNHDLDYELNPPLPVLHGAEVICQLKSPREIYEYVHDNFLALGHTLFIDFRGRKTW